MATADFYYDPLECTICLGRFTDPKILPCFHTFCLLCIEKHVKEDTVPAGRHNPAYFTCPLCRKHINIPTGGVKAFQTNFYIDAIESKDDRLHDAETLPVVAAPAELGSLDLQLERCKTVQGAISRDRQNAQNQLAEMRFRSAKIVKHLLELKQDCSEYAGKLLAEAADVRKEIEKLKQEAHDGVNMAFIETIHTLEDAVKNELDQADNYKRQVDGLIIQADAFGEKAEFGQKEDKKAVVDKTREQVVKDYTTVVNAVPTKFSDKKSVVFQKSILLPLTMSNVISAQTVFGKVSCQSLTAQPTQEQAPVRSSTASNSAERHDRSNPADVSQNVSSISPSAGSGNKTCSRVTQSGESRSNTAQAEKSLVSDVSCDSDSSYEAEDSMPSFEDNTPARTRAQRVQGAEGGADSGAGPSRRQPTAALCEPRVYRSFNAPVAMEVKHITPHVIQGQAWVNFGQAEPTVYLVDVNGHQIKMVGTGGDAHDVAVLDEYTLLIANPAQKRIKQVDTEPDSDMIGQFTRSLTFPATCITYNSQINVFAVAGKNNLQTFHGGYSREQWVVDGDSDILTKPCSVAFSRISDLMVIAVADPGTKTVYIFVECDGAGSRFCTENLFRYEGEGLGVGGLARHTGFQPVSVSGRENLLAVLDKTTQSIALLGEGFTLIGIVMQSDLQVPLPRSIAFTDHGSSCWRVWLGTSSGQIIVVDLPEFLSVY